MHIRTPNVIVQRIGQKITPLIIMKPINSVPRTSGANGNLKNVSASYVCASERAQRRRYEAVLDTVPSTNSIVSII